MLCGAEVLDDDAFTKAPRLMRTHLPIAYTVQYGESDLAFVCRMMERHGINSGGAAVKGKPVERRSPNKPKPYGGPHATRCARSKT
jgi:Phage tail baseplate hub (GPD)